ncbi:MAG TPA: nucleoside-triphosphatase [Natrialbaceae archaeon]|nr:nucleoside-triphosphatase [Natrialbaceae archaeon]
MNVLLTGERNVGKTTAVERVVAQLRDRGLDPVGFYTAGGPETLELVDVRTGERTVFASQSAEFDDSISVGRYAVDPAAIDRGLALATQEGDVLVVDEIGRLERRGEGFAPLLDDLDPTRYRGILLSVRKGVVPCVADHFPADADVERIEVTESNRDALPARIVELLVGGGAGEKPDRQ